MPTIIPQLAQKKRPRKGLIIFVVCAVVLIGAGVGFGFTPVGSQFYGTISSKIGELFGKKSAEDKPADEYAAPSTPTNTNTTYADASKAIESGKTKEATTSYKAKIDATQDSAEKAQLYMELSGALLIYGKEGDRAAALSYALQAEKLTPTAATAAQLAQVYEAQGNTEQMKKYRQLVVERDTDDSRERK